MSIEADKLAPREQREDDLMAKPKITAKPKAKAKLTARVKAKSRARPKTKPYDRKKVLEAIVERMVEGESLREICGEDGAPNKNTILRWLCDDDDLATITARARGMQADALDDDIQEVVNQIRSGTLEPHAGQVIIRAHQWRAGKMKPIPHSGIPANSNRIQFRVGEFMGEVA